MECVEEASRALLNSFNEFLDVMAQPRDEVQCRNAMVRAGDVLFKANRFSSVLGTRSGHAKFRRSVKTETSVPHSVFLDGPCSKTVDHDNHVKKVFESNGFSENLTKNFLESSSLNQSCTKNVSSPKSSSFRECPAKDPHLLQPIRFHQNLNAEPGSGSGSKGSVCLDLSSDGNAQPIVLHHNLNAEPGSSSKSLVCLELSSNGKAQSSVFHQNLNAEPGLSAKSSVCLDLSSNGKPRPTILHQNLNAELGSSSKSSVCLELSSHGKTPLHNSELSQTPFNFHQQLQQQKLQCQQYEQLKYQQYEQQQQMKHHAEMVFRSRINSGINLNFDSSISNPTMSSTRSFMSSLTLDGSVASIDGSSFRFMAAPHSAGQSSQHLKRKCSGSVHCGSNGPSGSRCHCAKKRKNKLRRSIIVPAISNRLADIPPDEYSWRKYGQKPIKGSHHPRGYYKCSMNKGCPAKKRVERCMEEPTKLKVTYENEHDHPPGPSHANSA